MFPRSEENTFESPTISVRVTAALSRPTSLRCGEESIPALSSPNTALVPALDTPTITNILLGSLGSLSSVESVQSGVPTRTTPTLTPTTLRNIEQLFEQPSAGVQPPEVHFNQAGFVPPCVQLTTANTFVAVDNKGLGGGVITLTSHHPSSVSPVPSSRPDSASSSSDSSSLSPMPSLSCNNLHVGTSGTSTRRTGGRRPVRDDKITPEEEEKRMLRRERNKQAAARCRKRRLDQTNRLQNETDALEEKRAGLQQEIQLLQQQREELEFVLAAHKPSCKRNSSSNQSRQSPSLSIKEEPMEMWDEPICREQREHRRKPQRPTSLSLNGQSNSSSRHSVAELGITIETPSTAIRGLGLNFESMMEGGTGLTPVSSMAPPISTGLTPLTTPIVTTASPLCGTQQRSGATELSSPESVPPKLVSL